MNPITYTLNLQRICLVVAGVSFCSLCFILTGINPYSSTAASFFVWLLLLILILFLTSTFTLIASWWVFSVQKKVLDISDVNKIAYQSLVSSGVVVLFLVMYQTDNLSIWPMAFVLITYILYEIWINSD